MINVLVTIKVKNFDLLAEFESKAVKVMQLHGGSMVQAFETLRNKDDSGLEIHVLEFPCMSAFNDYRSDPLLQEYSDLRKHAIDSIDVAISSAQKNYE